MRAFVHWRASRPCRPRTCARKSKRGLPGKLRRACGAGLGKDRPVSRTEESNGRRAAGLCLAGRCSLTGKYASRNLAVQGRPGYRRILQSPWFLIFYRVDETRKLVEIARVWEAHQDPDAFRL